MLNCKQLFHLTLLILDAGLLELRLVELQLFVRPTGENQLTSFCSLPSSFSRLSALTSLSFEGYYDHVDSQALRHLTTLQDLYLAENPTKSLADEIWVHHLPPSLDTLTVSGDSSLLGGVAMGLNKRTRPVFTVPCITGLTGLSWLSFQFVRGLRPSEWDSMFCLEGLSRLVVLGLARCGLTEVPAAVLGLPCLQSLCLASNRLEHLPEGPYLRHLGNLVLVKNKFSTVPLEAIAAATALTRLLMGQNPLVWTPAQGRAIKHIKYFT